MSKELKEVEVDDAENQVKDPYLDESDDKRKGQSDEQELLSDLKQIENLAAIDPSIRDTDEYKTLKALVDKNRKSSDSEEEEDEEEEEPVKKSSKKIIDEDEEQEEEDDEEEEGDDEDEDEEEEEDVEDTFGISRKKGKKHEALEIEVPDEFADFIEKKYSIGKVEKFFDMVDNLRVQNQELSQKAEAHDDIVRDLVSLPADIKAAIDAVSNGRDHVAAFNSASNSLDFNRDFDSQDKSKVVKHYFAEEISKLEKKRDKGDIDDVDFDDKVDLLYGSAKRLFSQEKELFNKRRADLIKQEEDKQKSYKSSIISSVNSLMEKYPRFNKTDAQRIRQRLSDGNLDSIFFNKDGTLKKNAAEKLAYAEFGERVIQELQESAEKRGESKANEKVVMRGNKKVDVKKAQVQKQQRKAQDAVRHLSSEFKEDPYA